MGPEVHPAENKAEKGLTSSRNLLKTKKSSPKRFKVYGRNSSLYKDEEGKNNAVPRQL